ncbi:MAG: hypothetical protein ACI814_001676, partial [Mariniblastus sp.]
MHRLCYPTAEVLLLFDLKSDQQSVRIDSSLS